jgi:uncharacterized protein YidB (DUF937 family)
MSLFLSSKDSPSALSGGEAHEALAGALAGSPLGDVGGLLDVLHDGGLDGAVEAWSTGAEHPSVGPDALRAALGDEHVQHLASALGVSGDDLLAGLSAHLPALAAHEASDASDEGEPEHESDLEEEEEEDEEEDGAAAPDHEVEEEGEAAPHVENRSAATSETAEAHTGHETEDA